MISDAHGQFCHKILESDDNFYPSYFMIEESLKWNNGPPTFILGGLASFIGLSVVLVIILEIRSRALKAKPKPKDYLFADSLHWVLSPTTGKLLIAQKEERNEGGNERVDNDDHSEVFYSVKSCFSPCSSEKELDYFSHFRGHSIWEEFMDCEGWPFGLCRKALMLPPLPSSPSDSWIWRKRNLNSKVRTST